MLSYMYIGLRVEYRLFFRFEFSRQIVEKYTDIRIRGNPSSRNRVTASGRTDRHDESNTHLSQFANAPKRVTTTPQTTTSLL